MSYSTVLFDLDHTLLDSATSERLAFIQTMQSAGVADPIRYFAKYMEINRGLWAAVERNELRPDDVKVLRFRELLASTDLDADDTALAESYVAGLGAHGELYPGTRAVLDALARRVTLGLITNGIGQVQRTRIRRLGLESYFDAVAISGEIGFAKPGVEIFAHAFRQLGDPDRSAALMVGDSLSSDVSGGVNYGIATCWFNPAGLTPPIEVHIDHQVTALHEVLSLVTS